jgi:hypothetical protein
MPGVVVSVQLVEAVFVTTTAVQLSLPVARTVQLAEQVSLAAVKLVVKLTAVPGASVTGPITGVLGPGWLFTTNTLLSVTFPELRTVPV